MTIKQAMSEIEREAKYCRVAYRGIDSHRFTLDASKAVIAKAVAAFRRKHAFDSKTAYYDVSTGEIEVSEICY